MQEAHLDDNFWDELDEADFEKCILKEIEFLSQNPSTQRKSSKDIPLAIKENSNHLNNGNCNAFSNKISNISKPQTKSFSGEGFSTKKKKPNIGNAVFSFDNSFTDVPKKQSFYKPLNIGASTSTFAANNSRTCNEKEENLRITTDSNSEQDQLDISLKEKARLEEENLVKQGEVFNLRCELKRKETILEAERIDHCVALDAAEKRGKEKASKTLMDMELKVKTLDKEIDRLQGDLLFKNREVEELLAKCKRLEHQPSFRDTEKNDEGSPSPKRRKVDSKISPAKSTLNFAHRFDFGVGKKVVKNAQVQTECKNEDRRRITIKVHSPRGSASGGRKAYYLLSSSQQMINSASKFEGHTKDSQSTLLARMIFSEYSPVGFGGSEQHLIKYACNNLEKILKEMNERESPVASDVRSKVNEANELERKSPAASAIPSVSILSVAQSDSETVSQNSLRILSLCLKAFLEESGDNMAIVIAVLESLSSLACQCSNLPVDSCDKLIDSLKKCCQVSSDDVIQKLLIALNSFIIFENFKRKICVNTADACLLRKVCNLFNFPKKQLWMKEISNEMVAFVAKLLYEPNILVMNKVCSCSSSLLVTFINHLFHTAELSSEDTDWHLVLTGVKVLHLWQCKDKSWWDRAPHLHSYTALLSTVVRKSKYLRTKGILDQHTWELLYDLYDVDEATS